MNELHFIHTLEEVKNILVHVTVPEKKGKLEVQKNVKFINNTDLILILFEMIENKYLPKISYTAQRITALSFIVGDLLCSIHETFIGCPEDSSMFLDSKESYIRYYEAYNTLYHKIFDKLYISEYPEHVNVIEDYYKIIPCAGYLTESYPEGEYQSLDVRK